MVTIKIQLHNVKMTRNFRLSERERERENTRKERIDRLKPKINVSFMKPLFIIK